MPEHVDLEINLSRWDDESYAVELRLSRPDSDADVLLAHSGAEEQGAPGGTMTARFDAAALASVTTDPEAYGRLLTSFLFTDAQVWRGFVLAREMAAALNVPMRVRLHIGPSAPELQNLYWETLRDPQSGSALALDELVLFSRFVSSTDWRPVQLRTLGELRALVVVAAPGDMDQYRPGGRTLNLFDVTAEVARATAALGDIPVTALASGGQASLTNMTTHLRDGYDILYLVCHTALIEGEPRLWLEDKAGNSDVTAGSELVARLNELERPPRLVVLMSSETAGMGPQLAGLGIPAVLAMQRHITVRTAFDFMSVFFRELQRDGQVDRAVAAARLAVRDRPDNWMPALFLRLRSGQLGWYRPGLVGTSAPFDWWPSLLSSLERGRCTPILGPGLVEPLLGSRRELARQWAKAYDFPLFPDRQQDLAQVAQYLAVSRDAFFPRSELERSLRREILRRYGSDLGDVPQGAALAQLLLAVGRRQRERDPTEPHQVLAGFPCPIYITTNWDNLLADALVTAGKTPVVQVCHWNSDAPMIDGRSDDYQPDVARPLVYHLFGHLQEPNSLVLTEDDYFQYLIAVAGNMNLIPLLVRRAFIASAHLFLGFQVDDLNFQGLRHLIRAQEGSVRLTGYRHILQMALEEGFRDLARARDYLEQYFLDQSIGIYWGSVTDFIKELHEQWVRRGLQ